MRRGRKRIAQTEQVMCMLREEYDACRKVSEIEIKPTLLAERVQKRIDKKGRSPTLTAWMAVLQLRKLASELTRPGDKSEDSTPTHTLFELQRYYPAVRQGEEIRVLREHLTVPERRQCAMALRRESASKAAHADALDAETDALIRAGILREDGEDQSEAA